VKLKSSQIKPHREALLKKQGYVCALCHELLLPEQAVLDHDHRTGLVRGSIHRSCNSALGKLENAARRYKVNLVSLAQGLEAYLKTESDVLHPTHYTPEEKLQRARPEPRRDAS